MMTALMASGLWRRAATGLTTLALAVAAFVTPSAPAHAQNERSDVIIVGDSIVAGNRNPIQFGLHQRGHDVTIDAQSGRTLTRSFTFQGTTVRSGVSAVRSLVQSGRRPALWIIELGTNDHFGIGNCSCPDPVAAAGERIDALLAELPPNANVAWVTVYDQDLPDSVRWFNTALSVRGLAQIPWFDRALGQRSWFLDDVHPSNQGVRELTEILHTGIEDYLDGAPPAERTARRLGVRTYLL